jgi:hypothetical protein
LVVAIAAVVLALVAATATTVTIAQLSKPDKNVNFDDARTPDLWAGTVDYGQR